MENSTKALIIAGSVLVAIVIIAIGINILSSSSDVTDQVNSVSDTMAKSVFNSQFTPYFDNNVSGTETRNLISKIMANNSTSSHKVTVYTPDLPNFHHNTTQKLQELYNSVSPSKKYNIYITSGCGTYSGGYDKGYIGCITIDSQ